MDDRLRLLKRIRFVCRVAQWLLLLAIVGWGYFYVRVTWQTVSLTGQSLTQAVMTLSRTLWDYGEDVRRDLVLYPPPDPADSTAQAAWLKQINYSAGERAGVFLLRPSGILWVRQPRDMGDAAQRFEKLLADSPFKPPAKPFDALPVLNVTVPPEAERYYNSTVALIAGAPDAPLHWGVLLRPRDLWQPVAARLRKAPKTAVEGLPDPLADRIETALKVTPDRFMYPAFRVTQDGVTLFASANLDTTLPSEVDTIFGTPVELFMTRRDTEYMRAVSWWVLFSGLLFLGVLFIFFEQIFRWAGRLRNSEPAPTNIAA